jgi:hypothetical protein
MTTPTTYTKSFPNPLRDEAKAREDVKRYVLIHEILKSYGSRTPDIISVNDTEIVMEYVSGEHDPLREPDWDSFHSAAELSDINSVFDESRISPRLSFWDGARSQNNLLDIYLQKKLKKIAFDSFNYLLENDAHGLIHMDPTYKNMIWTPEGNCCWIDFQEACWGPTSYDKAHFLCPYEYSVDFNMSTFTLEEKHGCLAVGIRQLGLFYYLGTYKNFDQCIPHVKYNCNQFLRELNHDLEIT